MSRRYRQTRADGITKILNENGGMIGWQQKGVYGITRRYDNHNNVTGFRQKGGGVYDNRGNKRKDSWW